MERETTSKELQHIIILYKARLLLFESIGCAKKLGSESNLEISHQYYLDNIESIVVEARLPEWVLVHRMRTFNGKSTGEFCLQRLEDIFKKNVETAERFALGVKIKDREWSLEDLIAHERERLQELSASMI